MNRKIVTNLRVDENVYLEMKALAGERGVSVNEYLNQIIREVGMKNYLGETRSREGKSIYDALLKLATRNSKDEPMGWREEDEAIYG